MNNKKSFISFLLSIIFFILITIKNQSITTSIYDNLIYFIKYSLPPLFLSISIGTLLIENNISFYLNRIIPNYTIRTTILSFILGFPNNILLLKNDYHNGVIDINYFNYLIIFTSVLSPFYIISIFKKILPDSFVLFIIIYYAIHFITSLLFINKIKITKETNKINAFSFKEYLTKDIPKVISQLLSICSIIIFFSIISSFLDNYSIILKGIIEFSSGINILLNNPLNPLKKGIMALIIMLFNSFSIFIQMSYYLKDLAINYKYYLISKVIILITGLIILTFCI